MQIGLTFEEMSKIILEHVRNNMNVDVNKVDIPSTYTKHREDFCVVSNEAKVEQVPLKVEPAKDEAWREDLA
jgi:hypothetical protein